MNLSFLPTVVGIPLIVFWIRRHQRKFEKGAIPRDAATRLKHGIDG